MSKPPSRRVVVRKDATSIIHYLQCAKPCQPEGWCMPEVKPVGCYLGGCTSPEGARSLAERVGYEVAPHE